MLYTKVKIVDTSAESSIPLAIPDLKLNDVRISEFFNRQTHKNGYFIRPVDTNIFQSSTDFIYRLVL